MSLDQRAELKAKLAALDSDPKNIQAEPDIAEPRNIPMDIEDKLRLENILLREKLMERDKKDARDSLHATLVKKYNVDVTKEIITMNAETNLITITQKD